VEAFYADRACPTRSDATRTSWGYTYRRLQRLHPFNPVGEQARPVLLLAGGDEAARRGGRESRAVRQTCELPLTLTLAGDGMGLAKCSG
jgi:hypothetical protein